MKDRFNNRYSYDTKLKYGEYEPPNKSERKITYTQTELLKKMYKSDKLNVWEKGFIKNCLRYDTLSEKQKLVLNRLFLKLKRCGYITKQKLRT